MVITLTKSAIRNSRRAVICAERAISGNPLLANLSDNETARGTRGLIIAVVHVPVCKLFYNLRIQTRIAMIPGSHAGMQAGITVTAHPAGRFGQDEQDEQD
ncbi:MAG: hypothetical protein WBD79_09775, partial [Anaerolineae bacterium]